jgi:hypothetical protein
MQSVPEDGTHVGVDPFPFGPDPRIAATREEGC